MSPDLSNFLSLVAVAQLSLLLAHTGTTSTETVYSTIAEPIGVLGLLASVLGLFWMTLAVVKQSQT
jgi:hypothetical protein